MATEKRLIDANAFECVCVNGKSDDFCDGVLYVLDMIDAQPTVDAVEVVNGEWTVMEDDYEEVTILECSVCEMSFRFDEYDGLLPQWQTYHYCPNCGAKMDGDGNA